MLIPPNLLIGVQVLHLYKFCVNHDVSHLYSICPDHGGPGHYWKGFLMKLLVYMLCLCRRHPVWICFLDDTTNPLQWETVVQMIGQTNHLVIDTKTKIIRTRSAGWRVMITLVPLLE